MSWYKRIKRISCSGPQVRNRNDVRYALCCNEQNLRCGGLQISPSKGHDKFARTSLARGGGGLPIVESTENEMAEKFDVV